MLWFLTFVKKHGFFVDGYTDRKILTPEDFVVAGEGCLLDSAEDGVVDAWFARDRVPQPLQRIVSWFFNGEGASCRQQTWKHSSRVNMI